MRNWSVISVACVACVVAAGCDRTRTVGAADPSSEPPADAAVAPPEPGLTEVTVIDWVLEVRDTDPPRTRAVLVRSFETGASKPHEVGVFEGACEVWEPGPGDDDPYADEALTGLDCWHAGAGTRVRVVERPSELVFVRAEVDEMTSDVYYEEMHRLPIRPGARLELAGSPR